MFKYLLSTLVVFDRNSLFLLGSKFELLFWSKFYLDTISKFWIFYLFLVFMSENDSSSYPGSRNQTSVCHICKVFARSDEGPVHKRLTVAFILKGKLFRNSI